MTIMISNVKLILKKRKIFILMTVCITIIPFFIGMSVSDASIVSYVDAKQRMDNTLEDRVDNHVLTAEISKKDLINWKVDYTLNIKEVFNFSE